MTINLLGLFLAEKVWSPCKIEIKKIGIVLQNSKLNKIHQGSEGIEKSKNTIALTMGCPTRMVNIDVYMV
jgi:hypothetical protein